MGGEVGDGWVWELVGVGGSWWELVGVGGSWWVWPPPDPHVQGLCLALPLGVSPLPKILNIFSTQSIKPPTAHAIKPYPNTKLFHMWKTSQKIIIKNA